MNKIMLMSFYVITAIGATKATYAENTSEQIQLLNSQIQSQLQKNQATTQAQIKQLNTQIQTQLKQIQSDFQNKLEKLSTQTEAQLKQVQESLQKQIIQVNEAITKGAVSLPQEPESPDTSNKKP